MSRSSSLGYSSVLAPLATVTSQISRSWVEEGPQMNGSRPAVERKDSPQWSGSSSAVEWKFSRSRLKNFAR